MTPEETFEATGFSLVPHVLSKAQCESLAARIRPTSVSGGSRCLLSASGFKEPESGLAFLESESWCASLAKRLRDHPLLSRLVPAGHVAVQCTYFEKSPGRNWLVPIHQDLSIPVAERVESPGLGGWSEKEGALFVQPPASLLEELVAIRVHLDDCAAEEGPLRVVPGSHTQGRIAPEAALALRAAATEVSCHAAQGSALVMRPLLLHASSKSTGTGRRRVLHFVFGPQSPGHGLRWHHSV